MAVVGVLSAMTALAPPLWATVPSGCSIVALGRVVDVETGAPIPGAKIVLTRVAPSDATEADTPPTGVDERNVEPERAAPSETTAAAKATTTASAAETTSGMDGAFAFSSICPGTWRISAEHVAYVAGGVDFLVPQSGARTNADGAARPEGRSSVSPRSADGTVRRSASQVDTLRLVLSLQPRVFLAPEVDVRAGSVAPLVDLERGTSVVPRDVLEAFPSRDLLEALAFVPGVLVAGDRPYFRGLGREHVVATIDGIVAREPITGRWLLPPPSALEGAEVVASAMLAEAAPTLGGHYALRLANGSGPFRARAVLGGDGLAGAASGTPDHEVVLLSAAGSIGDGGVSVSLAYQGVVEDGANAYDRSLPRQTLLGTRGFGAAMSGTESASMKLAWRPGGGGTNAEASLGLVTQSSREKAYHAHYARSGWVGYVEQFDRYTTFLESEPVPGRDVFYEGPRHVPVEEARSTLLFATYTQTLGRRPTPMADDRAGTPHTRDAADERPTSAPTAGAGRRRHADQAGFSLRAAYGDHALDTALPGVRFADANALRRWWVEAPTRASHQEEAFLAVHGDLPEFRRSRSREGTVGGTGWLRLGAAHDLRAGLVVTMGRHRSVLGAAPPVYFYGSFEDPLDVVETSAYLEDTWSSDARSWMRIALRHLARTVQLPDGSASASRLAPALAFHQPMTASAALHVEVGQAYQFPTLESHFLPSTALEQTPTVEVQRVRFVELGVQRHFSRRLVAYLGADVRQYVDVVFGERSPSVFEELTGSRETPSGALETREARLAVDYQITPRVGGQTSVVLARTTADSPAGETLEVPWSRRAYARSWLTYRNVAGFSTTLGGSWDTGRPYDFCLLGRGCRPEDRFRGDLPDVFGLDLAAGYERALRGWAFEASLEVQNLLGLEAPSYAFSVDPMGVTSNHFLAYWDRTGETNGYLLDATTGERLVGAENAETRTPGRSAVLAVGVRF